MACERQPGAGGGGEGLSRVGRKVTVSEQPPITPADISVFQERGEYVLRNVDGQSLYQYDLDSEDRSRCTGTCAVIWPPVFASIGSTAVVGDWKTIQRGN